MCVVSDGEYDFIIEDSYGRECGGNSFCEGIGSRG